jgi:hypothetical protein
MKFFTVGYGGHEPHKFVELLKQQGVIPVGDVRRPNCQETLYVRRATQGLPVAPCRPFNTDASRRPILRSPEGVFHVLSARGV